MWTRGAFQTASQTLRRRQRSPAFSSLHGTHSSASSTRAAVAVSSVVLLACAFETTEDFSQQTTRLDGLVSRLWLNPLLDGSQDDSAAVSNDETVDDDSTTLLNWSGTHAVQVSNDAYWEPETVEDVEKIIRHCHKKGQKVRPIGSVLSPNGIAFQPEGMVSMANLDQILRIDKNGEELVGQNGSTTVPTVTVQAGARVSQVVEALRPHGLTLPNLASIAEQQMGGFVQIGAHGTGRCISPVDEYVTKLKLVTPSQGTITLTPKDGEAFHLARVGLGCIGVVVEVTMQCVPAHRLVEHTFVLTRAQAKEQIHDLLKKHRHVRYMWIPYTDAVVVVTNDPDDSATRISRFSAVTSLSSSFGEAERFRPLRELLIEVTRNSREPYTNERMKGMGFGELRDALLAVNPLDVGHVKRCNQAEAEFWRRSEGYQVKPSDELLQFDCGGQQWVWEVCFPTGTQDLDNGNDIIFMERLMNGIEDRRIPAHSPIEQRWSASSSSLMSPAYGPANGLHSWVGIINYLPSEDERQRREITELFKGPYCDLMRDVGLDLNATSHWAKLEKPQSVWKLVDLHLFLQTRFPIKRFNKLRQVYDPKNILGSPLIDMVFGPRVLETPSKD